MVDFFAASGQMRVQLGDQAAEVRAPQHWRQGAPLAENEVSQLPEWIDAEPLSSSDRLASQAMEEAISVERPAGLALSELVGRRRSEVRSLAARSSVYVGQFEPFVKALKDLDQRAAWSIHIETLREALALSPQTAAKIRETFQRVAGNDGPALYRMLWGYSAADLKRGADQQLVDYLKSPGLDFRVLAFWNLRTITGLGLNYGPEYPEANRARSVQRWEQMLNEQKIRLPDEAEAPANGDPAKGAASDDSADGEAFIANSGEPEAGDSEGADEASVDGGGLPDGEDEEPAARTRPPQPKLKAPVR